MKREKYGEVARNTEEFLRQEHKERQAECQRLREANSIHLRGNLIVQLARYAMDRVIHFGRRE